MTTATVCGDFSRFSPFPNHSGFSDPVFRIHKMLSDTIESFSRSVSLGLSREDAINTVYDISLECADVDWDGYGALPVNVDANYEARKFLQLLPSYVSMPEVLPEPTGEIGLEWRKGKNHFVISVSGKNEITYAGIFGKNKTHGTEYFFNAIPTIILENFKRLG